MCVKSGCKQFETNKSCQMDKVDTTENLADFFTKILDVTRFMFLREKMMTEHQCVTDDKVLLSTSTGQ